MLQHIESFGQRPKSSGPKMLSEQPRIHESCHISDSYLGVYTALGPGCTMRESSMDDYSYLAGHVSCVWTTIGKLCSIAAHTRINPGNHPVWRVTTSHSTYRRKQYGFGEEDDHEFFAWRKSHPCEIGHDVWIGHGVTVLAGKNIGIGACVGAGAVVSKDIPPYAIAVGVPARVVKYRFDETVRERIMETEYWNWDHETLKARMEDLLDPNVFLEKYGR
ncbi:MAG: acetyltransferase [Verrucomicrobiota bacterium]